MSLRHDLVVATERIDSLARNLEMAINTNGDLLEVVRVKEAKIKELERKLEERLNEIIRLEKIIHKQQMETVDIIREHIDATEDDMNKLEEQLAERDALIREAIAIFCENDASIAYKRSKEFITKAREVLGE